MAVTVEALELNVKSSAESAASSVETLIQKLKDLKQELAGKFATGFGSEISKEISGAMKNVGKSVGGAIKKEMQNTVKDAGKSLGLQIGDMTKEAILALKAQGALGDFNKAVKAGNMGAAARHAERYQKLNAAYEAEVKRVKAEQDAKNPFKQALAAVKNTPNSANYLTKEQYAALKNDYSRTWNAAHPASDEARQAARLAAMENKARISYMRTVQENKARLIKEGLYGGEKDAEGKFTPYKYANYQKNALIEQGKYKGEYDESGKFTPYEYKNEAAAATSESVAGEKQLTNETKETAQAQKTYLDYVKMTKTELQQMKLESLGQKITDYANKEGADPAKIASMSLEYQNLEASIRSANSTKPQTLWGKIKSGADSAITSVRSYIKEHTKLLQQFGRVAKMRAMRWVLRQITAAFKEGISNLYEYSKATNGSFAKSMDTMASSLLTLKNAVATAVAPLIQYLIPVLQQVVGWIREACNWLAQFFATLNGDDYYMYAKEAVTEWGAETKKSAKSANNSMKEVLASFDELNVIAQETGSGSGSGNSKTTAVKDMFEKRPVTNKLAKDWGEGLKDIIDKVGGIGNALLIAGGAAIALKGLIIPIVKELIKGKIHAKAMADEMERILDKKLGDQPEAKTEAQQANQEQTKTNQETKQIQNDQAKLQNEIKQTQKQITQNQQAIADAQSAKLNAPASASNSLMSLPVEKASSALAQIAENTTKNLLPGGVSGMTGTTIGQLAASSAQMLLPAVKEAAKTGVQALTGGTTNLGGGTIANLLTSGNVASSAASTFSSGSEIIAQGGDLIAQGAKTIVEETTKNATWFDKLLNGANNLISKVNLPTVSDIANNAPMWDAFFNYTGTGQNMSKNIENWVAQAVNLFTGKGLQPLENLPNPDAKSTLSYVWDTIKENVEQNAPTFFSDWNDLFTIGLPNIFRPGNLKNEDGSPAYTTIGSDAEQWYEYATAINKACEELTKFDISYDTAQRLLTDKKFVAPVIDSVGFDKSADAIIETARIFGDETETVIDHWDLIAPLVDSKNYSITLAQIKSTADRTGADTVTIMKNWKFIAPSVEKHGYEVTMGQIENLAYTTGTSTDFIIDHWQFVAPDIETYGYMQTVHGIEDIATSTGLDTATIIDKWKFISPGLKYLNFEKTAAALGEFANTKGIDIAEIIEYWDFIAPYIDDSKPVESAAEIAKLIVDSGENWKEELKKIPLKTNKIEVPDSNVSGQVQSEVKKGQAEASLVKNTIKLTSKLEQVPSSEAKTLVTSLQSFFTRNKPKVDVDLSYAQKKIDGWNPFANIEKKAKTLFDFFPNLSSNTTSTTTTVTKTVYREYVDESSDPEGFIWTDDWDDEVRKMILGYAGGGFPQSGNLFLAHENGAPEYVGQFGSHTAVANNEQIVRGIAGGVEQAMRGVEERLARIERYAGITAEKDPTVKITPSAALGRVNAQSAALYGQITGR